MQKGPNIISSVVYAAILLTLLLPLSWADTIILKNGQTIETIKVDEHGKDIIFYLNGVKMRVSKEMVVRIVKPNEASAVPPVRVKRKAAKNETPSNIIVHRKKAKKFNPPPSKDPSSKRAGKKRASYPGVQTEQKKKADSQPAKNTAGMQTGKNRSEVRWCGFRDLRWGISRASIGIMQEIESGSDPVKIKEFVRKNEDLKFGKAQLDSIAYAFWRYRLYAVTIWVSGQDNYLALRNEVFNRFGAGLKSEDHPERYLWSDTSSDRMLKYVEADQTGLFWMRSKDLNRKYHLSQIKTPSTILKAMEANALRAQ